MIAETFSDARHSLHPTDDKWRQLYRLLAARRVVGIVLSLGGMVLSARLLPSIEYGLYLTASSFFDFALRFATPGLAERLLRSDESELDENGREAMGMALVLGSIAAAVALALWLLWKATAQSAIAMPPAVALFATLPLWSCTTIARSCLERRTRLAPLLLIELVGQVVFIAGTALWALFLRADFSAPVAGWVLQSLVVCGGTLLLGRIGPRRPRSWQRGLNVLVQGVALLGANQIWHLRNLVLPFIVAPTAGLATLASLQLGLRVIDRAQFLSHSHWRFVAIAAPQWRHDRAAISKLLSRYALVPAALVGACFFAVAACPDPLVVLLFGKSWSGIANYLPGLTAAALFFLVGSSYTTVLVAERRLRELATYHALNVAILAVGSAWLTPRLGGAGFVSASVLSTLAFLYLLHCFRADLPRRERALVLAFVTAIAVSFAVRFWGPLALAPLLALCIAPTPRATATQALAEVFRPRREGSSR